MAQKGASKKRPHGNSAGAAPTNERQADFLEAFAVYGNICKACDEADISRSTVYNWKAKNEDGSFSDPEFMKLYEVARTEAVEMLENEAWRRAVDGDTVPVTVAGEREEVQKRSDTLLIFLLKAHAPEKYRDRHQIDIAGQVEHVGKVTLYMPKGPGEVA